MNTRFACLLAAVLLVPGVVAAQDEPVADPDVAAEPAAAESDPDADGMDQEARALFQAGETAFQAARFADALAHFRRAYELSGRPELLYNIGLAADRLRRDDEALAAFEGFVGEIAEHPRRRDALARIEVLREQLDPRATAADADIAAPAPTYDVTPHLIGSVALGAVGLAGVVAAIVGLAGPAGCVASDASGCLEEEVTSGVGVGVYGGLGLAAVVGAVVWLVVGLSGGSEAQADAARADAGRWSF